MKLENFVKMLKDKIYKIDNECLHELIDGNIVILHGRTGKYHELKDTAVDIFNLIESKEISYSQLLKELNKIFQGTEITNDLNQFLKDLLDREIIKKIEIYGD